MGQVSRYAPERFFTNAPDAIDDGVNKPAFVFKYFSEHQGAQHITFFMADALILVSVAGTFALLLIGSRLMMYFSAIALEDISQISPSCRS
jgi:hypothetical protein